MAQTGTLSVRVFTSNAQLPIEGATVVVTQKNRNGKYDLLSVQATNSSGETQNIAISTPKAINSTSVAEAGTVPDSTCEVWAEAPGFAMLKVDGVQMFPDVVTVQRMELIPLEEGEDSLGRVDERNITAQNL